MPSRNLQPVTNVDRNRLNYISLKKAHKTPWLENSEQEHLPVWTCQ